MHKGKHKLYALFLAQLNLGHAAKAANQSNAAAKVSAPTRPPKGGQRERLTDSTSLSDRVRSNMGPNRNLSFPSRSSTKLPDAVPPNGKSSGFISVSRRIAKRCLMFSMPRTILAEPSYSLNLLKHRRSARAHTCQSLLHHRLDRALIIKPAPRLRNRDRMILFGRLS